MLLQLDVETYGDPSPSPIEIKDGVTSVDLFKVNRLFALMSYAMEKELDKIKDEKERQLLELQSVIPVMQRDQLLLLLEQLFPDGKAETVLSLLVMESDRDHVDLQYTPFICVDDTFFLAPAVIANSNLVRNSAQANRQLSQRIKGTDPMQEAVAKAFRDAGFLVDTEVGDAKQSNKSAIPEMDIVAYREGRLYVFECKNNYHPCTAHERRNSYESIKTAGKQLSKRHDWLADHQNQTKLFNKLGWTINGNVEVRTCVLLSNRVFSGAKIEGHPVRQAHELINIIRRGTIKAPDFSFRVWKGDTLTADDIDQFLGDNGLMKDHFDALRPFSYRRKIGTKTLVLESWYFDPEEEDRIFKDRYQIMARQDAQETP